jgi:hypothetical protein
MLSVIKLSVIKMSVVRLSLIVLSVITLRVNKDNVVRLSVLKLCAVKRNVVIGRAGNTKGGKYHCTVDLLFDCIGLVCFANKNKNCQLSYS